MLRTLMMTAAAACAFGGAAVAQDANKAAQMAHQVREAHMTLYAANLGPMGAMAKGEMEFDGELAAALAGNIASLARLTEYNYWVEGSDSESLEDSRALPAAFNNLDDIKSDMAELAQKADALQAAAGQGKEAFVPAFQEVGKTCGGCHEEYREPE